MPSGDGLKEVHCGGTIHRLKYWTLGRWQIELGTSIYGLLSTATMWSSASGSPFLDFFAMMDCILKQQYKKKSSFSNKLLLSGYFVAANEKK